MSDDNNASEPVPTADMVWQTPTLDPFSDNYEPVQVPVTPALYTVQDIASLLSSFQGSLDALHDRMRKFEDTQDSIKTGVNSIGEMMNWVVQTVQGMATQIQSGGLGALMGMMKGGKNG